MIVMLIFSWQKIKQAKRTKQRALRFAIQLWNMVDLIIVLLAVCFTAVFFYRSAIVKDLLISLENARHNEYVSFNSALFLDFIVDILAALLVMISTVRLWKLLRFLKIFRVVELTFKLSWIYLVSFTIIDIVVFFAYSAVGQVLFGSYSANFKDLKTSFLTVILLAFGFHTNFDYRVFMNTTLGLGYIFYMGFTLIFLGVISIFVTIIIVSYQAAKAVYDATIEEKLVTYSLFNFIRDEYRYFTSKTCGRLTDIRLSAGVENVTQIIQDVADHEQTMRIGNVARKKVTVAARRIRQMNDVFNSASSLLIRKSMQKKGIEEMDDIMNILRHSCQETPRKVIEGEKQLEFIEIPQDTTVKYCSLKRMQDMKLIVEYLLSQHRNKSVKKGATIIRLETKQDANAQERIMTQLNTSIFDTIKHIKAVLNKTYADKSTNVFFEDLGLEEVFD